MTLSLTNPVENLLKVTLLKIEQAEKGDAKENDIQDKENKPDENADKNDDKNEKENKKESEEEKDKDEHEVKEKSDAEQEKGTEKDEKKDSSHVEVAVSKKPHRSMDNSCESRSFVSTAEVKLNITSTVFCMHCMPVAMDCFVLFYPSGIPCPL